MFHMLNLMRDVLADTPQSCELKTMDSDVIVDAALTQLGFTLEQIQQWRLLKTNAAQTTNQLAAQVLPHYVMAMQVLTSVCLLDQKGCQLPTQPIVVDPKAPAAFVMAVRAEEALSGQGHASCFPHDSVLQTTRTVFEALDVMHRHLATLERLDTTLREDLQSSLRQANLEAKLEERYSLFAKASKNLRKQRRAAELELSDSDSEEEDLVVKRQELKQAYGKVLTSFRRDWNELLRNVRRHRPELLLRHWCELQSWALRPAKAKSGRSASQKSPSKVDEPKLQPWLESMLSHLDTEGLQRAELTLQDYDLLGIVSESHARHVVQKARAPNGEEVALKRYTISPSDHALLRKVRAFYMLHAYVLMCVDLYIRDR
jgi:hypothetical protein